MKRFDHPLRRAAAAAILLIPTLCLNACDRTPESLKRFNMTALAARLQPLFEKTKTVCFGRFILEVPATAIVVFGPMQVDWPIDHFPADGDKVLQYVTEQLVEVEKNRKFLDKDDLAKFSMFGKVIDGAVPGQKLVFGSKDQVSYTIDSFIPVGKDLFVQHADRVISKEDEIKILNTVARNLRLRTAEENPTEPGACIDGGFVTWQPEYEKAALGVRLKEFPDVHFSIEVTKNQNYLVEFDDLERRLKDAEKDGGNWYSRIKFFRRGPRQLGDWKGFEVLAHKPAQEKTTESHEFHFRSLGAINDPLQPQLDIQLDTGVKDDRTATAKPSLTDEEAVALWDKLTASIRVRPTGGPKQSASDTQLTPLGQRVVTGRACPQTGWWQCIDAHPAQAGRRHLSAGEPMPRAMLLGTPNLWEKLTGQRPTYLGATVWELVEYGPVPVAAATAPIAATGMAPPREG